MPRRKSTHVDDPRRRRRAAARGAGACRTHAARPRFPRLLARRTSPGSSRATASHRCSSSASSAAGSASARTTWPPGRTAPPPMIRACSTPSSRCGWVTRTTHNASTKRCSRQPWGTRTTAAHWPASASSPSSAVTPAQAISSIERALQVWSAQPADRASLAETLGRAKAMIGQYDESISIFRGCLQPPTERKDTIGQLRFAVLLANALIDRGDFTSAAEVLASTLETSETAPRPASPRTAVLVAVPALHVAERARARRPATPGVRSRSSSWPRTTTTRRGHTSCSPTSRSTARTPRKRSPARPRLAAARANRKPGRPGRIQARARPGARGARP